MEAQLQETFCPNMFCFKRTGIQRAVKLHRLSDPFGGTSQDNPLTNFSQDLRLQQYVSAAR